MGKTILFLCTHNSARSQLAEGLTNHYFKNYSAKSAGTEKNKVNPFAIQVLSEIGIDISHHESKLIDQFLDQRFDTVLTVCDNAKETCPFFPNTDRFLHQNFEDPSKVEGSDEVRLEAFRKTRDQILEYLKTIL